MTRVLCLTSWYPPHHFGGYETSCHDVMVRLAARGHRVEVLTSDHRHAGVEDSVGEPVAAVHRRLRLYFRDGELWSPGPWDRLRVERHNQAALADAVASARPQVVAVWHVGAMSLGLITTIVRMGIPIVYAVSDEWPAYARQLDAWTRAMSRIGPIKRLVETVTRVPSTPPDLDSSGAFCFISESTRRRSRAASPWGFPHGDIVYSGIDTDLFQPDVSLAADRPAYTASGRRLRLLYVGRIDERKGIRTLVTALGRLDAELVIDGRAEANDHSRLAKWAEEAGVAGKVTVQCSDRSDLPDVYRSADICIFPSEWEEPFGLVPLEAMACGTPVVASGVGGSGEYLHHGENCILFEPGDPGSLAEAIGRVAADPDLRTRIATKGIRSARHFSVDHLADALENWYVAAAAGHVQQSPPSSREPPVLG